MGRVCQPRLRPRWRPQAGRGLRRDEGRAQEKLRKLQNDAANGADLSAARTTTGEWLTRWLVLVKPTVEPNTYGPYERHVRLHITPHVGRVLLGKLAAVHVQGMYAALAEAGVSAAPCSRRSERP